MQMNEMVLTLVWFHSRRDVTVCYARRPSCCQLEIRFMVINMMHGYWLLYTGAKAWEDMCQLINSNVVAVGLCW